MNKMRDEIITRLREVFSPTDLDVIDESDRHQGHAGWREGGGTHFRIKITAPAFDGISRVARERAISSALKGPLENGVHALSVKAQGLSEAS